MNRTLRNVAGRGRRADRGASRGAGHVLRARGISRPLVHGRPGGRRFRTVRVQRPRIVGHRAARPVGGVRGRALRRPLRRCCGPAAIRRWQRWGSTTAFPRCGRSGRHVRIDDSRYAPVASPPTSTTGATTSACTRPMSRRSARWSARPSSAAGSSASRSCRSAATRASRAHRRRGDRRHSRTPGRRRARQGPRHGGRGGRRRGRRRQHRPRRLADRRSTAATWSDARRWQTAATSTTGTSRTASADWSTGFR